ncbi:hypothetical protein GCM10009837_59560 [Streptomyces durmitorensis]
MSITRAEQMSMNPVLAADSCGASAAIVMPGGIGVSSSSYAARAGGLGGVGRCAEIGAAPFPGVPLDVSPQ